MPKRKLSEQHASDRVLETFLVPRLLEEDWVTRHRIINNVKDKPDAHLKILSLLAPDQALDGTKTGQTVPVGTVLVPARDKRDATLIRWLTSKPRSTP